MGQPDVGEYIVGAYLKVVEGCDAVDYHARPPGGGLKGLGELDVIGLHFETKTAFLCEVTTHIRGTLYKDNPTTVKRIAEKYQRQKEYAARYLAPTFTNHHFMFWSPVVPKGYLTTNLAKIEGIELVINQAYAERVDKLVVEAGKITHDIGNPFFRTLQIMARLRR